MAKNLDFYRGYNTVNSMSRVGYGNIRGSKGYLVQEGCRRCKIGHTNRATNGVQVIPPTSLLYTSLDISITGP